jgi:LuxR family maltose regulon positive regulatory protein
MARGRERAPSRIAGQPEPAGSHVVAATKLHPPAGRLAHVSRPALVARLGTAPPGRLAVVSAPAGWGKTTLLADWYASETRRRPVAWLSLDPGDDDPVRFLTCVVESLRRACPELGEGARAVLRAPGSTFLEVMVPALINELEERREPLALVLEDYHVLTSREIHEGVAYLVEHLPPALTLVVATRSDPPFPLARLRARGELTEVRADELRFSLEEAGSLLNDALKLGIEERQIARLHERTEGWAAGLYLAALSLRGRVDVDAFIEAFAGDDRHVVDYLALEVLDRLPADVRSFLARTSVLRRLSGPLCDAVTGRTDSAELLEETERSNLFVVPLDTTRRWYRYHRLFATLLRRELENTEPGLVPELHRRAAAWFRAEGEVADEIRHVLEAGDTDDARRLVAAHWNDYFNQGRLATVSAWLDALPPEAVTADAALCSARAWIALDLGRLEEAARWIEAASALDDPASEHGVAILRTVQRFKAGDLGGAGDAVRGALALDWSENAFGATVASCLAGIMALLAGRPEEAVPALEEAARLAGETENQLGAVYSLGYLALALAELGRWDEAGERSAAAVLLAGDPARSEHFVAAVAHLARGRVLAEQGELAEAAVALRRSTRLSARAAGRLEVALAWLALADVVHALGERAEARHAAREARRSLQQAPGPGALADELARVERRVGVARSSDGSTELTDRELAVLRLLATDLSRREIAAALFVSLNTVKTHTRGVFRKLGVSTRDEARARARELGLL